MELYIASRQPFRLYNEQRYGKTLWFLARLLSVAMSKIALQLQVFVASPDDVAKERKIAEEEIRNLGAAAGSHRLLVAPYLWESERPRFGRPQGILNEELDSSELILVILSSRVGKGTLEEIERACLHVRDGRADDLALYVRKNTTDVQSPELTLFLDGIRRAETLLYKRYLDEADFRAILRKDLGRWLMRWEVVPEVCEYGLSNSPPYRVASEHLGGGILSRLTRGTSLNALPRSLVFRLGEVATEEHQRGKSAPEAVIARERLEGLSWEPFADKSRTSELDLGVLLGLVPTRVPPLPLIHVGAEGVSFASADWYAYFCAKGLEDAILQGRVSAVQSFPYPNTVHQILSTLHKRDPETLGPRLLSWLTNENDNTGHLDVARNFAAYVLGMIGYAPALDALAIALREDRGEDVALYSITSLGKMRSRRHLGLLVEVWKKEEDQRIRLAASQSVCRIVGVANYEL